MIVSRAISRLSIIAILFFVFFPSNISAQIAPTNTAAISGSVNDSTGRPVTGATVSLSGPKTTSTHTDVHGLFVFVGMPLGMYQISAIASGLGTAVQSLQVTGDVNVAIQYQLASQNLKTIAHVSSAVNASFNVTPASVTQVNPMANAFEGKTSWRTILEQIPGVAEAGLNTGEGAPAGYPDGPLLPMKISIDGALPYETAILLDDMPLIAGSPLDSTATTGSGPGSGTDLGYYPLNGFASADVVRGPGANAPSIVDSIGGSFMLHGPGMADMTHYDLSLSNNPYGGIVANAQAAIRLKKLSLVVTYGVNDSPGPLGGSEISPNTAIGPSTINGTPCGFPCFSESPLSSPHFASASFPRYGVQTGLLTCCLQVNTGWSQHNGSAALIYAVSPSVTAEVFYAGLSSAEASLPGQLCTTTFTPPAGYTGSIAAGTSLFSTSAENLGLIPVTQTSSLFEEKITAQLGHGMLRIQALQNRAFLTQAFTYPSSATVRLFGGACLASTPGGTGGCPAGYALTVFNGGAYTATYSSISAISRDASNNRDLLLNYATSLGDNFHAGASFVRSYYDEPYTSIFNLGFFSFTGGFPSSVSNTTNEFRIFAGGNFSEKTSLDLSMYFANANYHVQNPNDLTGNTYTDENYSYAAPRLGFVWRPTASVAVRASAGGGFAEAQLCDLVGTNGTPQPNVGGTYYTTTLSNLNLQPEKSFSFDLGSDIRLPHSTIVSFDVYRSNLYGQVYRSAAISGTYTGVDGTLPLYVTQYGNLGESRYEGILIDVRHNTPQGIFWSLSGGLTRGYVVSVPAGFYNKPGGTCVPSTGVNCQNVTVVPGINFNGTFAGSVPYSQALGTIGYRWNSEKYVDVVGTSYGNNNTYFVPAFTEFDGYIGYPLSKNTSLLVTFRNITGIYGTPFQILTQGGFSGAPTISGLPYAQYNEPYGPRAVILTANVHL